MFENADYIENEIAVAIACDCCCEGPTVGDNFNQCEDYKTVPVTASFNCKGRLLKVDVTVNACQGRKVAVGVLISNDTGALIRFKVCEDFMPPVPADQTATCTDKIFHFCFIFANDVCNTLSFNIKAFAEYANFDFNFDCN